MSRLVLATADTTFEERVRDAFEGELGGPLRYWHDELLADPKGTVRELANTRVEVVAVGPNVPREAALDLARQFERDRPDISVVIVAPPSPDLLQSALRAGARDVVAPDAPATELRATFERALESASNRRAAFDGIADEEPDANRVIITLCPKGGAGKTTVATNLALGLAQSAPGDVVIIDLDLQFGDVASSLGLRPELTFADVARHHDDLDTTTVKAHLTAHASGLFALCAPSSPTEADDLTPAHVERVLALLAESFPYVVVDTPSGLDEATLAALAYATDIVLLSATDVPSIRSTRKEVDALRVIGRPTQQWHFVLNRADAKTGLTISAIEQAVGVKVDVAIPSSRAVPVSLNQGEPVIVADPRAPVSLAMQHLVGRFAPVAATADRGRPAGIFRRR